jgi:beta-lactamase regulating signal transducer with metallopeptidase domain
MHFVTSNSIQQDLSISNSTTNASETYSNIKTSKSTSTKKPESNLKRVLLVTGIIVSLLALISLIGTVFVVYYRRRGCGSYSTRHHRICFCFNCRKKRLPIPTVPNEKPNTPAVLYTQLQTSAPTSIPMVVEMRKSTVNCDPIRPLPPSTIPTNLPKNILAENNEEKEPYYATVKS